MNEVSTFLHNLRCFLVVPWKLLCYALRFCWLMLLPKVVLAGELIALQSQLGELAERVRREAVS